MALPRIQLLPTATPATAYTTNCTQTRDDYDEHPSASLHFVHTNRYYPCCCTIHCASPIRSIDLHIYFIQPGPVFVWEEYTEGLELQGFVHKRTYVPHLSISRLVILTLFAP